MTINLTKTNRRGPGRPRKDGSLTAATSVVFRDEAATAFILEKEKYEKDLPYRLTYAQFLDVLLSNFNG
tara:strand:- start:367 stop:573 length:207 start_codon:yes stop_codon:yes gene_type:complete